MNANLVSAVKSLQDLLSENQKQLDEKEEKLQHRIEEFEKKVELFEKANPKAGKSSDVLMLNVGGQQIVAVLRSTLTQCEDSMLAAKFSGRWDDSLEKDPDGHFFIDQDPGNFQMLLSFLRDRANANANGTDLKPRIRILDPSLSFCVMVRYYQLMPYVFPLEWRAAHGKVTVTARTSQSTRFVSDIGSGLLSLPSPFQKVKVAKFSVEVPWDAKVGVGWITYSHGAKSDFGRSPYSFGVTLSEQKFVSKGSKVKSFLAANNQDDPYLIECNWDGDTSFTVCITGAMDPPITQTFSMSGGESWHPAVQFRGATIPITTNVIDYVFPRERILPEEEEEHYPSGSDSSESSDETDGDY